ncbi:MAG: ComEC/Rec2 family competence protein [bacterium]|nr:ComEC/Rec2 family competence protein [bacterium]
MRRLVVLFLAVTLVLAILPGCGPARGQLVLHFLDVGQGDAILVRTPAGLHLLIDTGPDAPSILDHLRRHGVRRLDVLVLTHPHQDHIGGARAVLADIPVATVYDSGKAHTSRTYESLLEAVELEVEAGRTRFILARAGMRIDLDPAVTIEVLHPGDDVAGISVNNCSVVLKLTHGQVVFLLPGDAETEVEEALVASGLDLTATVLKVGHHGSRSSTGAGFLAQVGPRVAVIMCGVNPYGHPHPEVLDRLRAAGADVYSTRDRGTISVFSDGRGYRVRTDR